MGLIDEETPVDGQHPVGGCVSLKSVFIVSFCFSSLFALLVLQYSFQHGRLLYDPTYDDVGYLHDGLQRVSHFHRGGVEKMLREYIKDPPHSPAFSLLAATGFAFFGPNDWAPYACQMLWVFLSLLFVRWFLPTHSLWTYATVCGFVLTVPLLPHTVHEFRPDIAWGLACAVGTILLLWHPLDKASLPIRLGIGAVWGLAFWIKPSAFPLTSIHGAVALAASWWIERGRSESRPTFTNTLRRALPTFAVIAAIGLPHFLLTGLRYPLYLWNNLTGPWKEVWAFHGGLAEHLTFYLTNQYGGRPMLGDHLWLMGALIAGAVILCTNRVNSQERRRYAAMLVVLLSAYLVPTAMRTKSQFIGAVFYWILIFVSITALSLLLRLPKMQRATWRIGLLILLLTLGIWTFAWPQRYGTRTKAETPQRRETVRGLCRLLVANAPAGRSPRVFFGIIGTYCNDSTLSYVLLKDFPGSPRIEPHMVSLPDPQDSELGQYRSLLDISDIAIACNQETGEELSLIPNCAIQDRILALVKKDPSFVEVGTVPTFKGKVLHVFRRQPERSQ